MDALAIRSATKRIMLIGLLVKIPMKPLDQILVEHKPCAL